MTKNEKTREYSRTKEFRDIRSSLLSTLEAQGRDTAALRSKVEEYMSFWVRKKQLEDDISARGLTVTDDRDRTSENRSVSLEIQVSRQMIAILQFLGLRAPSADDNQVPDDDDL